ncbi:protein of unknown function [Enterobacter cancerogenus]|nr:protein of unknown function [Enterobacter cancerogenus]
MNFQRIDNRYESVINRTLRTALTEANVYA